MAFLERVQPDPEIRAFLQRFMGLCLTGDPTEQAAIIHHGLGANGKSVFLELMRYVLGDYGETIAAAKLIGRDRANGGSPDPALARLAGVRLLTASEPEPGAFVQEDVLKNLLGMETISVRDMYAGLFDFLPVFKVMIACNEKPRVKGGDDGIWRRLHLVPWSVTIPAAERDRGLLDALKLEANGILAWAVEGYKEWRRLGGLKPPEVIRAATDAYRSVSDPLGDFFNDCVERPAPGAHIEATDMYLVYLAWCDVTQTTPITQKTFGMAVTNRGFDRRKVSTYRYLDCKLKYWADASPQDLIERGRQRAERGGERSGDRRPDGLDV
jgi:putative DNA primase/helicase